MTVQQQMLDLLRLQELAAAVSNTRTLIANAPARIEEIEERFRKRNTEYVEAKGRYDEIQTDHSARNVEVAELQTQLEHFNENLMKVQNQREYAAILKEIDDVKTRISAHETTILEQMDELEKLKEEIQSMSDHINTEREVVAKEVAAVEEEVGHAETRRGQALTERVKVETDLPKMLLAQVLRLETSRQGLFLSRVEDGTCQSCYVRIRPQAYQEIKTAVGIHSCGSCKRLLYHEPTLSKVLEAAATAGS